MQTAVDRALKPLVLLLILGTAIFVGTTVAQEKTVPQVDYPRVNLATGYHVDTAWPAQKPPYPWEAMAGIAVDDEGLVWTLNRGEMPVQVYDAQGKLVRSWGRGLFKSPHQLSIGPRGDVWIADSQNHAVYKFTPQGDLLLTLGVPGEPGDDDKHFKMPTDVVETLEGDVFVADGYRNNRVVHFGAKGQFVKTWGELGVEPGNFSLPHSIALDSQGRLYVADRNNGRIQVFDQSGRFLAQWRNRCVPWTVRVTSDDRVYVCGSSPAQWRQEDVQMGIPPKDQLVMQFDTDGELQHWWSFPLGQADQAKPGELAWVHGLAIDATGNLYLGDIMGKRVQRFTLHPAGIKDR